jgi:hypothetical protein
MSDDDPNMDRNIQQSLNKTNVTVILDRFNFLTNL